MDVSRDERQEEPNVVPLIDISLVILVMALVISSVAGRLLPMEVPKSEKTRFVEAAQTAPLTVSKDGAFQLGGQAGLGKADLSAALGRLEPGTIVLIRAEPGTPYELVVAAIDSVRGSLGLKLAFGSSRPTASPLSSAPVPGRPQSSLPSSSSSCSSSSSTLVFRTQERSITRTRTTTRTVGSPAEGGK